MPLVAGVDPATRSTVVCDADRGEVVPPGRAPHRSSAGLADLLGAAEVASAPLREHPPGVLAAAAQRTPRAAPALLEDSRGR